MKSTRHATKTPRTATGPFVLLGGLLRAAGIGASKTSRGSGVSVVVLASVFLLTALPVGASAYATIEGPPVYSTAPGLPDGRVYEQVSPADKNGNEAGAKTTPENVSGDQRYGLAAADGNSVLFEGTGPMGEDAEPAVGYFVASKNRSAAGWTTRVIVPKSPAPEGLLESKPAYVDPSPDLSHIMFESIPPYAQLPEGSCNDFQMFLSGPDPFVAATWLERPAIEEPVEPCGSSTASAGAPVGGSPDFSTVYFTYPGTLLPEDAARAPHAHREKVDFEAVEAWGFYEDREGVLREAGVLPDGSLDPFGAVPAASGRGRAIVGNQVSADGSRAFFVSPDPASCEQNDGHNNCAEDPPELYVREAGTKTLLVSQDTLLSPAAGLPAHAPVGVLRTNNQASQEGQPSSAVDGSYVFASPDGSQAFFQSEDQLTSQAPEGPPGNTSPKTYDFDVDTGSLTYLPNVAGQIVATDTDGSSFAFVRPAAGSTPAELDLWSAAANGGSVTPVTQLPEPEAGVSEANMSSNGSVLVFVTGAPIAGFNNGGTHLGGGGEQVTGSRQLYRYEAPANTLGCVSCPPHAVTPTGDVWMSALQAHEEEETSGPGAQHFPIRGMVDERGISTDGSRILFDSPDPLVPQDTNTGTRLEKLPEGGIVRKNVGRDVYEWENAVVYLISSGKSTNNSYLLDSSEDGSDVFFATPESLVPGDTDGGYDVYDARVPHPGDNPPAAAVPCEGSVCQGPPNVPAPLTPPASATFSGLGNPPPEVTPSPPPKKASTKTVKCDKGKKLSHGKCVKKSKSKKTKAKKSAKGSK